MQFDKLFIDDSLHQCFEAMGREIMYEQKEEVKTVEKETLAQETSEMPGDVAEKGAGRILLIIRRMRTKICATRLRSQYFHF